MTVADEFGLKENSHLHVSEQKEAAAVLVAAEGTAAEEFQFLIKEEEHHEVVRQLAQDPREPDADPRRVARANLPPVEQRHLQ